MRTSWPSYRYVRKNKLRFSKLVLKDLQLFLVNTTTTGSSSLLVYGVKNFVFNKGFSALFQ